MIKSAEITNYRCYKKIELKGLKRVNVILGRNASGKTALLEALLMPFCATPDIMQRIRIWHGLPANIASTQVTLDREIWRNAFNNFDLEKKITIKVHGTGIHERALTISYNEKEGFMPVVGDPGQSVPVVASPLKYHVHSGNRDWDVKTIPVSGQLAYLGSESTPPEAAFFSSNQFFAISELVERFSTLIKRRDEGELVDEVTKEFSFIRNIQVASQLGAADLLVDINGQDEKISIGLVSGGVHKIVSILAAISAYKGGVIFVDEIENGVYYDRYGALWQSIYRFAEKHQTQLFVATHNLECLKALAEVSSEWIDDVSFMRTVSDGKDYLIEQFHGTTGVGALKTGEIR